MKKTKKLLLVILPLIIASSIINEIEYFSNELNKNIKIEKMEEVEEWKEIANDVIVTVYNAVESQCNKDVKHTASMFKLNLKSPELHRIVAMERTMMSEFGIKYGDIIKIKGTYKGLQDGIYQVHDTMNKRFAGQHKIDVLVKNGLNYGGTYKDEFATVYVLNDKSKENKYRGEMAPEYK